MINDPSNISSPFLNISQNPKHCDKRVLIINLIKREINQFINHQCYFKNFINELVLI